MSPRKQKPKRTWRCRTCGRIWKDSEVYQDLTRTAITWTCGGLLCGGVCDWLEERNKDNDPS